MRKILQICAVGSNQQIAMVGEKAYEIACWALVQEEFDETVNIVVVGLIATDKNRELHLLPSHARYVSNVQEAP